MDADGEMRETSRRAPLSTGISEERQQKLALAGPLVALGRPD